MDVVMPSFNRLIQAGVLEIEGRAPVPMRPLTVADMQGTKATYGMSLTSHSVWCSCGRETQHSYPTGDVATFEDMMAHIDGVGCSLKTEAEMCSWAHYPLSVHRGGKFKPFECSYCKYKPSEKAWHADLARFNGLSDEDQEAEIKAHVAGGAHHHQNLFSPPLPHLGMCHAGVDNLHLTYLNCFKHIFKYTVHEGLPDSNKAAVARYVRAQHFYSYDAQSEEDDPCKTWIGREVKRFIEEAATHLPVLLRLASAPADIVAELSGCVNGAFTPARPARPVRPSLTPTSLSCAQMMESRRLNQTLSARSTRRTWKLRQTAMPRRCSSMPGTGITF